MSYQTRVKTRYSSSFRCNRLCCVVHNIERFLERMSPVQDQLLVYKDGYTSFYSTTAGLSLDCTSLSTFNGRSLSRYPKKIKIVGRSVADGRWVKIICRFFTQEQAIDWLRAVAICDATKDIEVLRILDIYMALA